MSEYSIMWKYSLIVFRKIIQYDSIDGVYVKTYSLSFMLLFCTITYLTEK